MGQGGPTSSALSEVVNGRINWHENEKHWSRRKFRGKDKHGLL